MELKARKSGICFNQSFQINSQFSLKSHEPASPSPDSPIDETKNLKFTENPKKPKLLSQQASRRHSPSIISSSIHKRTLLYSKKIEGSSSVSSMSRHKRHSTDDKIEVSGKSLIDIPRFSSRPRRTIALKAERLSIDFEWKNTRESPIPGEARTPKTFSIKLLQRPINFSEIKRKIEQPGILSAKSLSIIKSTAAKNAYIKRNWNNIKPKIGSKRVHLSMDQSLLQYATDEMIKNDQAEALYRESIRSQKRN
ncbi:unnamed protein product [Blepharisma stoltei]|uniref:Uncharacterized protein n=1 Tax=Blepharisma stoltei TaxID=1481888 RepID=A0AAU9IND5_9CILI|nr:unnamed protein product [Blepharisma stoltei]